MTANVINWVFGTLMLSCVLLYILNGLWVIRLKIGENKGYNIVQNIRLEEMLDEVLREIKELKDKENEL